MAPQLQPLRLLFPFTGVTTMRSDTASHEFLQGYVVDVACLRRYPQDELIARAREHTRHCALEGHCVESGYALVDDTGRVAVLDSEATPKIVAAVNSSRRGEGIRLRVQRTSREGAMQTDTVEELA